MTFTAPRAILSCLLCLFASLFSLDATALSEKMNECLLNAIAGAKAETTVAELRTSCESEAEGLPAGAVAVGPEDGETAIQQRIEADWAAAERNYVIMTHRPNYILYTYNDKVNQAPFEQVTGLNDPLDDVEMKFQVSAKMPLAQRLFNTSTDLYVAYTAQSWWQLFNDDLSSPFRETNYEPEIFVRHYGGPELLGMKIAGWDLGFNHQSNGRGEPLSRSWNRIIGAVGLDMNELTVRLRGWYRIPEDDEDDDNPHMHRYYGYGDALFVWTPNRNTFTAMLRPGTEKAAYELTWSFPLSRFIRVYAQYFNGYGESLIDYNVRTERIGIGFALNDYLQQ